MLSHSETTRCINDKHCNCHGLVKQLTMGSHNKCDSTKKAFLVKGELLNAHFEAEEFDVLEECQVCLNVADRIKDAKVSIRKRAQLVVLDAEKCRSEPLMDPRSLKVDGIKKIAVSYTDDTGGKNTTTIIFWSREQGQESDIGCHSPLTH